MYRVRKKFKFEAAHKLVSSYSKKCQKIHGHSYVVEVFLQSETLNEDGMVIDFGQLKDRLSDIFGLFDHMTVLSDKDKSTGHIRQAEISAMYDLGILTVPWNPTAENMAKAFYEKIAEILYRNEDMRCAELVKVRVHETETGWAEYEE